MGIDYRHCKHCDEILYADDFTICKICDETISCDDCYERIEWSYSFEIENENGTRKYPICESCKNYGPFNPVVRASDAKLYELEKSIKAEYELQIKILTNELSMFPIYKQIKELKKTISDLQEKLKSEPLYQKIDAITFEMENFQKIPTLNKNYKKMWKKHREVVKGEIERLILEQ